MVASAGVTVTDEADCVTDTEAFPEAEPDEAVTVVAPEPSARTRPVESTDATAGSALLHSTAAPGMGRPTWSNTSAKRRTVSPNAIKRTESGVTATVVGAAAATTNRARPSTPDDVAVISTAPVAMPVASPVESIVAT